MALIEQKYILLIMNCEKYRDKAESQKETWLRHLSEKLIYFHVIGIPNLETPFRFDTDKHILYVQTEDDYNSLPKKVIHAYNAVLDAYMFTYIFKTDDDQNLLQPTFFDIVVNLLEKKTPKVHYGGNVVDVTIPYKSQYYRLHPELPKDLLIQSTKYCSGRFYLLSWESVLCLSNKKNIIGKEYLEDYAIGYHLSSYLKDTMLHIHTDKYFIDKEPLLLPK